MTAFLIAACFSFLFGGGAMIQGADGSDFWLILGTFCLGVGVLAGLVLLARWEPMWSRVPGLRSGPAPEWRGSATTLRQIAHLEALEREREGYIHRKLGDRVKQVDEQMILARDEWWEPEIHIKRDRSTDLTVRLRPEHPQAILLEIGVENSRITDLTGVHANILIPRGLRAGDDAYCDLYGRPKGEGSWAPPTLHRLGDDDPHGQKEYWNETGLVLNAGHRIFAFKLHLTTPGEYRVLAKFWGGDLGPELSECATIRVVAEEPPQEGRDRISESIYAGERMLGIEPDLITGDGPPPEYLAWYMDAHHAIPPEFTQALNDAQNEKGHGWKDSIRTDLRVLYEIRGLLGDQP